LIFAAIDPCICCAERAVDLLDARTGEQRTLRFSDLRRMANDRARALPQKRNVEWPF